MVSVNATIFVHRFVLAEKSVMDIHEDKKNTEFEKK